jgi:hypothetical protein
MANAHDFKEDFAAVSRIALASAERLLTAWLPEGKRIVREFKCGDLSGRPGTSLPVMRHRVHHGNTLFSVD